MNWPEDYVNAVIHGDCREIMKEIPEENLVIITDPVWPNANPALLGSERPYKLFKEAAMHFPRIAKRVIIHLGCTSDPRFLIGLPSEMKFLRNIHLRYAQPSFVGRILWGNDTAYVFGEPPKSRPGHHLLPGEYTHTNSKEMKVDHPNARRLSHVKFIVSKYTEENDIILDPFAGAGTTGVAAFLLDRKYILIEIVKKYCEEAERYITRAAEQLKLALK